MIQKTPGHQKPGVYLCKHTLPVPRRDKHRGGMCVAVIPPHTAEWHETEAPRP